MSHGWNGYTHAWESGLCYFADRAQCPTTGVHPPPYPKLVVNGDSYVRSHSRNRTSFGILAPSSHRYDRQPC